jgi:LacI family transcriptional regulator
MHPIRRPVSLRDLAKICGLSVSAVSYALRDDPHVSVATRKLVAEKARQLRYRQDGRLSELMSHLRTRRSYKDRETLGILHDGILGKEPWKEAQPLVGFHNNVVKRAEELGYNTEAFPLNPAIMPPKRLTQILTARGIRGLIIAPPSRPCSINLMIDTSRFAIAQCLHSIWEPDLPRVEPHHFDNTLEAIKSLRALGYKSAGLVLPERDPHTTSHLIEAGCDFAEKGGMMKFVPIFGDTYASDPRLLLEWYRRHRPEVVISYIAPIVHWFQSGGVAVPSEVGVCGMGVTIEGISGINFLPWQIDSTVVDLVIEQLHHNQLGVPRYPKAVFVRGQWQTGETLRQLPPSRRRSKRKPSRI